MLPDIWPKRIDLVFNCTTNHFEGFLVPTPHGLIKENLQGIVTSRYFDSRNYAQWTEEARGLSNDLNINDITYISVKNGKVDSYYYNSPPHSTIIDNAYKVETKHDLSDGSIHHYYHFTHESPFPINHLNDSESKNLKEVLRCVPDNVFCRVFSPKSRGNCVYLTKHHNFKGSSGEVF